MQGASSALSFTEGNEYEYDSGLKLSGVCDCSGPYCPSTSHPLCYVSDSVPVSIFWRFKAAMNYKAAVPVTFELKGTVRGHQILSLLASPFIPQDPCYHIPSNVDSTYRTR